MWQNSLDSRCEGRMRLSKAGPADRPSLRLRLSNLSYQPESARDLRLDLLRGFAVFAMVVDHLAGPSQLHLLTGGNRFFTSAAEGFIFISGLLVGLVYRRFADRDGLGPALRRLLGRALQLYVLAVGLTLIMLPASELLNLPWAQGIDLRNPVVLIVSIFTTHRTYYLVDVPLLYTLLLLVAPLALLLMVERRTWVVLAASWLLWIGYQVFPEEVDFPWPIAGNYLFYFSAWQVLFFTAMVIGYHHERLPSRLNSSRWRLPLIAVLGIGFLGLLLLYRYTEPVIRALQSAQGPTEGGESIASTLVELLFAKGDLRIGRIIASAIVFSFVFLVTTEFWVPLRRGLGWLLLPLGQDALYAYSAHVIVALILGVCTVQLGLRLISSQGMNLAIQLISLALIWLAIRWRVLYPRREHLRRWMVSPGLLVVLWIVVLPLDPSPEMPGMAPPPAAQSAPGARAVRVFGTPIPRDRAREAARAGATPVPLPPPPAELRGPAPLPAGEPRASEFVGRLQGAFRDLQFYSAALDREMSYFIYLPPNYATEGRRYPVLYMLHGGSADKDEWPAYGLIDSVDSLIDSKVIRPMIIVLPQGDFSYWMNHVNDGPRWGDYVAFDLVRHIDASFRSLPDPERRAIGGLSMGGHGALQLAFNHPNIFRAVGSHSPSLHEATTLPIAGEGEEFASRDPVSLAAEAPDIYLLNIWIDIGEDDIWVFRADELHQALEQRGVAHEWSTRQGEHEAEYWQRNLVDYLIFYDKVLNWREGS